ncbi:MAG: DoxX family protein, partial [Chloroflexota bacterium]|nr:DoxX family protein [Chloroflexota bacterium]
METAVVALQLALAIVLAAAGAGKLMDLGGSRRAMRDFGIPERFAHAFGTALPIVELTLALLLLFGATVRWGAIASGLLFLVFIAAIGWNLKQGRHPDCHCFGQIHSEPAGISTLLRNTLLSVAAGIITLEGGHGLVDWSADLPGIARGEITLGILIVAATAVQLWFMKGLQRQNNLLMSRLESLESMVRLGTTSGSGTAS